MEHKRKGSYGREVRGSRDLCVDQYLIFLLWALFKEGRVSLEA